MNLNEFKNKLNDMLGDKHINVDYGRYIVSLDGKNDLWRGNNYDEAYDEFINERSKYLYKMDIILIDTLNNETLEYYDAQEDREQDDLQNEIE